MSSTLGEPDKISIAHKIVSYMSNSCIRADDVTAVCVVLINHKYHLF